MPLKFEQVPPQTSFETVASVNKSAVFSDVGDSGDTSVATSIMGSPPKSQDLLPTQEGLMLLEDEDFRRSFEGTYAPASTIDIMDLSHNTPFKREAILPRDLPFWFCWEIHRLALELDMLPIDLSLGITKGAGNGLSS